MIDPFYVARKMAAVGLRHIDQDAATCQFFRQLKDGTKKIGKRLVFKERRVFQKP